MMTIQNPATHAQARQKAAYRYDAERKKLSSHLEQRLRSDTRLVVREQDALQRRELALKQTTHMLVPLSRFIKDEIRRRSDQGAVEARLIDSEDILMATMIEAAERLPELPSTIGIYPWLRRLTQKTVRETVGATAEQVELESSLEAPIRVAGTDWPDRALLLIEVLEDPNAVVPEELLERQETRKLLEHGLDQLPARWREVFLLRSVDAWDDDEIAAAEGIDVSEVELINIAARAFLRDYFQENELLEHP
jgi:DNA-directed RNA polymerase specialized sigma24 family protein